MKYIKQFEDIDWYWLDEEEDSSIPDDFKGNKDFYNFLKDNDALEKWINNFNNKKTDKWDKKIGIKKFLGKQYNLDYKKLIDYSFYWENTPEGHLFWSDLEKKWIKNITKYNENIDWEWVDEEEPELIYTNKLSKYLLDF